MALAASTPTAVPLVDHGHRDALDIGCGTSDTLETLALPPLSLRIGVEADREAVRVAAKRRSNCAGRIRFVVADGHALPFPARSFGIVISKVAMPYMNLPLALREVNRVLRPGGQVWMTLHPVRMALMRMLSGLRALAIRDVCFQTYTIVNGLLLHYWGRLIPFPLNRRKIESVQTLTGIARVLSATGFGDVLYERRSRGPGYEDRDRMYGRIFAVAARKTELDMNERAAPDERV